METVHYILYKKASKIKIEFVSDLESMKNLARCLTKNGLKSTGTKNCQFLDKEMLYVRI